MLSIKELFRIGVGPSSSHTIGPGKAAERFRNQHSQATTFQVTLYGSLAATGKGHLTDSAIIKAMHPMPTTIIWKAEQSLPFHPNGMLFEALDEKQRTLGKWTVYSVGGGALSEGEGETTDAPIVYDKRYMADIMSFCEQKGLTLWEYVELKEGESIWEFLAEIKKVMWSSIERGLQAEGVLPGELGLQRKAWTYHRKADMGGEHFKRTGLLSAFALAVAEENASGGEIVTAPTCGSSGVLPSVLYYMQQVTRCCDTSILKALATAGLLGNIIKTNASISGAEVGCQGEIGAACSMAAGAATQLMGGTPRQLEYAAEIGLEHYLGLTCDPVGGLVQIPCIERNAFAAIRAVACADYALFSDGCHRIPYDEVIAVMLQTGHDLPSLYRETSTGGLAAAYQRRHKTK